MMEAHLVHLRVPANNTHVPLQAIGFGAWSDAHFADARPAGLEI
jgi:hypothetical protein